MTSITRVAGRFAVAHVARAARGFHAAGSSPGALTVQSGLPFSRGITIGSAWLCRLLLPLLLLASVGAGAMDAPAVAPETSAAAGVSAGSGAFSTVAPTGASAAADAAPHTGAASGTPVSDVATSTAAASPSVPSRRQILGSIVAKCEHAADHVPCLVYDPATDHVLLKDIAGRSQFLLLPIAEISGIESPAVLRKGAPSYFYEAWNLRRYVIAALGKPLLDTEISLAINPITARSQDHLHIHMDCVRADVRDALAGASISNEWSDWSFHGSRWQVRRLPVAALRNGNLFAMVAHQIPRAAGDMAHETIFVTGAPSARPDTADATDLYVAVRRVFMPLIGGASAEDLQDHACGLASQRVIGPRARP